MTPDEDPGWPRGLSMLVFLLPGGTQWYLRRKGGDALITLRQVMLTFSAALLAFGVVLPTLSLHGGAVIPWLPVLAGIAVVCSIAERICERPLVCDSDEALANSYRTRFFLRVAFSESIALFAFVFVFIGAALWIYYAAALVALFQFWSRAAPTRTALGRDQAQLNATGCTRSLSAALRTAPSGGRRPRRR